MVKKMKKYPRTYHLPFSPEVHSDDKLCDINDVKRIIDEQIEVVISEKLDGGACALKGSEGVMARSHGQETSCSSFNYIKNVHYYPNMQDIIDQNLIVCGENLFAIHSIEYSNLQDFFYVYHIANASNDEFVDYDDLLEWTNTHNMLVVPEIYRGTIPSMQWLEKFLADELKKPSALGGEREGFVVRVKSSFNIEDFSKNVFKYVRKNHVQNKIVDENGNAQHWSRNWVAAKLNKG